MAIRQLGTNFSEDETKRFRARLAAERTTQQPQQQSGGFKFEPSALLQEGTAVGGAASGAAIGTAILPGIGTLAGAGIGGFLGSLGGGVAESKIRDDKFDLGSNLKEATLDGVLSAGPLKLAKAGIGARSALKGGATAGQAVKKGLQEGSEFTIRGALGSRATESGKNLAVRPLGLQKGQKTRIRGKTGSGAVDVADEFGISSYDDITKNIDLQNQSFGDILTRTKGIPKKSIKAEFDKVFAQLNKGKSTANQAKAKAFKQESDKILKQLGDSVDGEPLNVIKKEFDDLVTEAGQFADQSQQTVNKKIADALRKAVQNGSGSDELKQVGKSLQKLKVLEKEAAKNLEAGTGRSGLRASDLIAGTPFGLAGGVPGALAGATAARALSTPAAARVASRATKKLGTKLTASGQKAGAAAGAARNLTLASALGSAGQSLNQSPNIIPTNPITNASINSPINVNTGQPPNVINDPTLPQNGQGFNPKQDQFTSLFSPENIESNVNKIIAAGGNMEDVMEYLKTAEQFKDLFGGEEEAKPLTGDAQKRALTAQSGLRSLDTLDNTLETNPGAFKTQALPNPLGITAGLTGTSEIRAATDNIIDVIARLRSGAAITQDEANRFGRQLPQPGDSPEAAAFKLNQVRQELEGFVNPSAAL